MIKEWGPAIWDFLHIFCQRIDEKKLLMNKNSIYEFLMQILCNLPCPECSFHAREHFLKLNFNNLKNKNQLIQIFFNFHNDVSCRINKKNPNFKKADITILNKYKNTNIKKSFNTYYFEWTKASSIKNIVAMTSSFSRNIFIENAIKWMKSNLHLFEQDSVI